MKKLEYGKKEVKNENGLSGQKQFRHTKLAAVLTSVLSLVPFGCSKDMVARDLDNVLCSDETISIAKRNNEATLDINQGVVFPNGYKMALADVEGVTQTAFFVLKEPNGTAIYNLDMKEGIDYTIEFPAVSETVSEARYKVAACSVRSGDASNEISVTVRANTILKLEEQQCTPNLAPTDCTAVEPVARTVMTKNKPLKVENVMLYFEGTLEEDGKKKAVFRFEDSCGNTLARDRIPEGHTLPFFMWGVSYEVDLFVLYSSADGVEWADVKVEVRCSSGCPVASMTMNVGDSIILKAANLTLRLDDVELQNDVKKALLSILDESGSTLARLALAEGETEIISAGYRINVSEVSIGYTFNAKWARISVSQIDCE